jgi:hypothetical protein
LAGAPQLVKRRRPVLRRTRGDKIRKIVVLTQDNSQGFLTFHSGLAGTTVPTAVGLALVLHSPAQPDDGGSEAALHGDERELVPTA